MDKYIFDTSVWVDFFRKNETENSLFLKKLLETKGEIYICPQIYQEIIQGINEPNKVIDLLDSLNFLELNPYFVAKEAGKMYQILRKSCITIRKSNDCSIAFFAIHFNIELVHNDVDFEQIAKVISLPVYKK